MRLAFITADLTMLRYFVPFGRRLAQFLPDIEQTFFLYRGNSKYNGLSHEKHYDVAVDIIGKFCPHARITTKDEEEFDVVVQVEVGSSLRCKRRISIQHGFDYVARVDELKKQVDLYICSSSLTETDALRRGVPSVAAPIPVCMWNVDEIPRPTDDIRTVLVFYPDQGDTGLAGQIVEDLEALGFIVFVKQRRKHQPIACGGHHVFDDVWYPSEAIVLPISVDVVIGFGSSAYTDLVPMGVPYINVDIHHGRSPWNAFVHPDAENYTRITEEDAVRSTVGEVAQASSRVVKFDVDVEQLRAFVLKLFE